VSRGEVCHADECRKREQIGIAYRLHAIGVRDQPRLEKAAAEELIGKIFMIGIANADTKAPGG